MARLQDDQWRSKYLLDLLENEVKRLTREIEKSKSDRAKWVELIDRARAHCT